MKNGDSLTPTTVEGETRIRDIDLGERLGFVRPNKIRELIERWMEALLKMGRCPTVGYRPAQGGKETNAYYLNRKQAIFITAKAETAEATEITIEIIEKFDAYERGLNSKESLAARRMRVMEANAKTNARRAANNALMLIGKAGGTRSIARNASRVYGEHGFKVDMGDAFDQGELFDGRDDDDKDDGSGSDGDA
ncbi:Rha family transcriptional regulator [Azospirillum himalayense]|uniref:Rha family transcriptional regulator n=1 Tax=Azospirillum himalayense TaxID=654847 RepID=A0ABW0GFG1_9PROT